MKATLAILFSFFVLHVIAQKRDLIPVYVQGTAYKNSGWFVAPGITYMLPEDRRESLTMFRDSNEANDTLYSGDFTRAGKIGLYLEAGRHKFITGRYLINHLDYGVHFKMLRGRESFAGNMYPAGAPVPVESNSKFSESFVGAFFNASNIIQFSNKIWLQNSIGVNGDFRVIKRRVEGMPYGADWNFPNTLLGQLHYKIGFGWKPEAGIYIMPMIETPILTAYPWDNGKSSLQYFVGRDRPLIITVRIQWLDKAADRRCEGQPGKGPAVDPDKGGRHRSNDLFGNDTKKMKRQRRKSGK